MDDAHDPVPLDDRWYNLTGDPRNAPRCGAKTRHSKGSCRQPAMPNGRCRLHGGKSTGPLTYEGKERHRAAVTTHGNRSASAAEGRALIRELLALAKESKAKS